VSYSTFGQKITVTLAEAGGTATVEIADVNDHYLIDIENIKGSSVGDTITGNNVANTIWGNNGDDVLDGFGIADWNSDGDYTNDGIDSLIGGNGSDRFIVRDKGATVYDGQTGATDGLVDTVDFSFVATEKEVNVDLATNSFSLGGSSIAGTTFLGIEGAIGGAKNDLIKGTTGANDLRGMAGDDTLIGKGGTDYIDGGEGTDFVSFAYTAQNIKVDLSINTTSQSTNDGSLTIKNVENLEGGTGNDNLKGGIDGNTISGGYGNDTLFGNLGDDTLRGGLNKGYKLTLDPFVANTDYSFSINGTTITVNSGTGTKDQLFENLAKAFETNTTANENGIVTVVNSIKSSNGVAENALYFTVQTDDVVTTSAMTVGTAQTFQDTADYSSLASATSITVNLKATDFQVTYTGSRDKLDNIEIIKGGQGADNFTGSDNNDTLLGHDGDDIFIGNDGDDNLQGELGNDTFKASSATDGNDFIDGGAGSDTVDYSILGNTHYVEVNTNGEVYTKLTSDNSTVSTDTTIDIENIIGGAGNDIFRSNSFDNTYDGKDGVDTLNFSDKTASMSVNISVGTVTGDGADVISNIENFIGGTNDDIFIMKEEAKANVITGGINTNDIDTVSYEAYTSSGVKVDLAIVGTQSVATNDIDTLIEIENLTGSGLVDTLKGDGENNTLMGGAGNDTLQGRGGDDILNGGDDIDTADFSEATGAGIDVDLFSTTKTATAKSGGSTGTDTLVDIENIIGTSFDDSFRGDTEVGNSFDGGEGNDTVDYNDLTTTEDKIVANLTTGIVNVKLNGANKPNDTLSNIENVIGTGGDDTFTGNSENNTFTGVALKLKKHTS